MRVASSVDSRTTGSAGPVEEGQSRQGRRLKIIHLVDSMAMGGAEMLVALLAQHQRREGHDVAVHCLFEAGSLAASLEESDIPVRVHGVAQGHLAKVKLMRRLHRTFSQERPDVVHCHNMSPTILGAPAARLAGARAVICTRHGLAIPYYAAKEHPHGVADPAGALFRFRLASAYCDRVVAVCEAAQLNLERGPGSFLYKVTTIRNGALPMQVSPTPDKSIKKDGFTLISVARLNWKKNQVVLLRAVAIARQDIPDLQLWLIGDGAEADTLRRLAAELGIASLVRFAGERKDVGDWLNEADLFVLSSLTEGLPISLLEAMAVGLPFVVTNVGGMPEIAELSGAGTVVESNAPEAFAAAIVQSAQHPSELHERGRKARECYGRYFTPETMLRSYSQLYQECIRRR